MKKDTTINFVLEKELAEKLKKMAYEHYISKSEFLRLLILKAIKEQDEKNYDQETT